MNFSKEFWVKKSNWSWWCGDYAISIAKVKDGFSYGAWPPGKFPKVKELGHYKTSEEARQACAKHYRDS